MSVLTTKKPRQEKPQDKLTAHQRLSEIDGRIREARASASQKGREQQVAAQMAVDMDLELITAEGRHGAGQLTDAQLVQVRKSYDAAKADADKPWKRDLAVAEAKVTALEDEQRAFLAANAAELAAEVTERAKAVQARIIANHEQRGEIAAEIVAVQQAWKSIGYTTARFPLEDLATEWRREARVFDRGSVPLIVPESR